MSSRNINNKQSKKPFCKVCQDAGKPESEYTSHYVRSLPDRTGKTVVTCRTLLATECRYCYKLGHTTKFCPVIKKNKKPEDRAFKQAERRQTEEKKQAPKFKAPSSGFAALADFSDSEEEVKVSNKVSKQVVVEEFPILGTATMEAPKLSGWASIAAKTQVDYQNEKYEQELIAKTIKRSMPPLVKTHIIPKVQAEKKSWADWSDSEDEQEEFEQHYEAVAVAPKRLSAAEMDWAAQDSESDEDW